MFTDHFSKFCITKSRFGYSNNTSFSGFKIKPTTTKNFKFIHIKPSQESSISADSSNHNKSATTLCLEPANRLNLQNLRFLFLPPSSPFFCTDFQINFFVAAYFTMPLVGCISWSLVGRNWQLVVPSERTSEFRGKRSKLRFWSEELKVLFWIWLMLILKPSWHSAWLVTWSTRAPCCFCQHARGTIKAALTIITLTGVEDLLRLQCWHQRRTLIFAFFLLYCFTAASSRVSFVVIKKKQVPFSL